MFLVIRQAVNTDPIHDPYNVDPDSRYRFAPPPSVRQPSMSQAFKTIRHGDTVAVELNKAFSIVNAAQGLILSTTVTNAGVHYFVPHSSDATTDGDGRSYDSEKVITYEQRFTLFFFVLAILCLNGLRSFSFIAASIRYICGRVFFV